MSSQTPWRAQIPPAPADAERGAVVVEFALVLPFLMLLIFGMLELGLGLNNLSSLRHGTREAARQAVVADFGGDTSCPLTGISLSGESKELACLAKERIALDEGLTRVKVAFPTTNDAGEDILVCTQYPLDSITGFLTPVLQNRTLTTKVEMRIEDDDPNLSAFAETSLSGTNWSSCA